MDYSWICFISFLFSEDEDEDDDDDDDEKDLLAELERIKNERMLAQAKKEQEQAVLLEKSKKESAIKGNPLINIDNSDSAKVYIFYCFLCWISSLLEI